MMMAIRKQAMVSLIASALASVLMRFPPQKMTPSSATSAKGGKEEHSQKACRIVQVNGEVKRPDEKYVILRWISLLTSADAGKESA